MEPERNLAKNLIAIRRARGLSQEAFSRELCIARSTLQQLEQGHLPTLSTLTHIARWLDCPVSHLLDEPDRSSHSIHMLVLQLDWFTSLSPENQRRFLSLSTQLMELLLKQKL